MSDQRVVEVKRHLDGREDRFVSSLVDRTPWRAVIYFRVSPGEFETAVPLDSFGCFWRRRPYNCYYIVEPATGKLVMTRFDVLRDVEFDAGEVRFTDLLLDLRVEGGVARWEDEDEVAAAVRAGLLSPADRARLARARAVLERGHARVAAEVRRLLRSLGRLPG